MIEALKVALIWLSGGLFVVAIIFGITFLWVYCQDKFFTEIEVPKHVVPSITPISPSVYLTEQIQICQKKLNSWFNENFNGNPKQRGQLYERYVGYRWEREHYKVEYIGIYKNNHGRGDGGIDLICHDEKYTWIVQCKNYQNNISPAQVQQHSGVVQIYAQAHPDEIVGGAFFATSFFSAQSKQDAEKLGIELFENEKLIIPFPVVKCKILSNEKLFFLPVDADYDNLEIDTENGDCYCLTVLEATTKGFIYGGTYQINIDYGELRDKYENIYRELAIPPKIREEDIVSKLKNAQDRHTLEFEQAEKLKRIENVEKIS